MDASTIASLSTMMTQALALTQRVGALLVQLQTTDGLNTRAKSDGSPVTYADRAAHAMLADELPSIAPYLVVSEESGPQENADRLHCERVWIVDPLDGTREYIKGSSEFTVNVALVENGVPVLGVMDAPGLGLTYFAQRGYGAFRRDAAGIERISCQSEADAPSRIVVSGSDIDLAWTSIAVFAHVTVRAVSSCIKLGFVADGGAIAYPRLTGSNEWDIAAGHAVLLEAGGRVVGTNGDDLRYNKPNPLNTSFVATGSPQIAAAFGSILAPGLRRCIS